MQGDFQRTYGDSSRFLNECNNMFAKVNGGTMPGVMENRYHGDYVIEKKLRDTRIDRLKERRIKKDPKRNTNAQNYRELDAKRRLVVIDKAEALRQLTKPHLLHPAGEVPVSSKIVS